MQSGQACQGSVIAQLGSLWQNHQGMLRSKNANMYLTVLCFVWFVCNDAVETLACSFTKVEATCHCGIVSKTARCSQADFTCGKLCGQKLACGHRCPHRCHPGPCPHCTLTGTTFLSCPECTLIMYLVLSCPHTRHPHRYPFCCHALDAPSWIHQSWSALKAPLQVFLVLHCPECTLTDTIFFVMP